MAEAALDETSDIHAAFLARIEDLRVFLLSVGAEQHKGTQLQTSGGGHLRPEVQKFITACETIHGLLASGAKFTSDEIGVIEMSARELLSILADEASEGGVAD
jgi:hypothetical protein